MTISLRNSLLGIALAGVSIAALSQASMFWLRLVFTATAFFLAWCVIGAVSAAEPRRTFWRGAAVTGWLYFALLAYESPASSLGLSRLLITHQVLEGVASAVDPDWSPTSPSLWGELSGDDAPWNTQPGGGMFQVQEPPAVKWIPGSSTGFGLNSIRPPPGYSYHRYLIIGHCLFLILTALVGGWCAKRAFAPRG